MELTRAILRATSKKEKKKSAPKRFIIFLGMELSSSKIKKFLIFPEMKISTLIFFLDFRRELFKLEE